MARYLITGAGGFTGQHMAVELARRGHEVHGIIREALTRPVEGLAVAHVCDLNDSIELFRVVRTASPDKVVHLAGISHVDHGDVDEIYKANLLGSRHLLEALIALGTPPTRILMASSANIYGNRHGGVITEDSLPDPANDYAISKVAMEHMARLYAGRLPIVIVRPFNYTGVGQSPSFLVPKIIDHFKRRASSIDLGNIDVERDWSDVRDVVAAYIRLLNSEAAVGGTFNVSSGVARSLQDVITLASTIAGVSIEVRVNPAFVRASEVKSLCGSNARLEAVIGPLDRIPLEDTLRWMLGGA